MYLSETILMESYMYCIAAGKADVYMGLKTMRKQRLNFLVTISNSSWAFTSVLTGTVFCDRHSLCEISRLKPL